MNKKDEVTKGDKIYLIIGLMVIVLLIITVRTMPKKEILDEPNPTLPPTPIATDKKEEEKEDEKNISDNNKLNEYFSKINDKNYTYTYTINEDGDKEIITGNVYQNKNKLTIVSNKSEKYLIISDNILKQEKNEYINVDGIRDYWKFIELENIYKLLEQSIGKEEKNEIIYDISVFDIIDEYDKEDYNSFLELDDDEIKLTLEDGVIKTIEINYNNYYKYNNKTNFTVKMEFNSYGKVEDFEI